MSIIRRTLASSICGVHCEVPSCEGMARTTCPSTFCQGGESRGGSEVAKAPSMHD